MTSSPLYWLPVPCIVFALSVSVWIGRHALFMSARLCSIAIYGAVTVLKIISSLWLGRCSILCTHFVCHLIMVSWVTEWCQYHRSLFLFLEIDILRLIAVTPPQPDETDLGEMIHLVCLRPIEGSTCTEKWKQWLLGEMCQYTDCTRNVLWCQVHSSHIHSSHKTFNYNSK